MTKKKRPRTKGRSGIDRPLRAKRALGRERDEVAPEGSFKTPPKRRRARAREQQKLEDAREKLARLSAGGAPERAIDVKTAAVVERVALALGCARCEGELRLEAHDALGTDHGPLRRVRGQCKRCRAVREVWLRVIALN